MEKLSANKIRSLWIQFWHSKGHAILPSASLVPKNDPSLLWINSGVATLKDYFAGEKTPTNPRMANSQKSIRTNDIENVGKTARHHTLFEMLGNFSIGEYFKDEALEWAYEFLFDVLKFDPNRIYITYYEKDDVTYHKWKQLGINASHLIKGDRTTNFWDLGVGPCGPDTEVFYDRGPQYDPNQIGLKLLKEDLENDRYVEIWNIVFSQFNNDGSGNYTELKHKNIDTGAGLERIASIFQNAPTNFDTDLFLPLIQKTETMVSNRYVIANYFQKDPQQQQINKYFRIIADHIRAVTQAINDGAKPSSTQRGYVIRRLIRRAYYSGLQLGIKESPFLYKLVQTANNVLPVYPLQIKLVANVIKEEEIAFARIINQGEMLVTKLLARHQNIDEKVVYHLFETYGLPLELTKDLLQTRGIEIDVKAFETLKRAHAHKSQSKQFARSKKSKLKAMEATDHKQSIFVGYDSLTSETFVLNHTEENGLHYLLLKQTPFYATSGGQMHDHGTINNHPVADVFKDRHGNHWHVLKTWDMSPKAIAKVASEIRHAKACNHSSTHILGHALRQVVSPKIIQLGSENNENKLRFDFPMTRKLTPLETRAVEEAANKMIQLAIPREYIIDTFKNGLAMGALAIDNEIEGDPNQICRIVKFGSSIEFCGGTHVANTSVIERLKIIKLETKGSGIYRIEAITSHSVINEFETKQKAKLTSAITILTTKIRQLQPKGTFPPAQIEAMSLEALGELLVALKAEHKQLRKQTKNIAIDFDVAFQSFCGIETFIKLDVAPANVKNIALKLSQKYPEKLFIIGAKTSQYLLAIASKKHNSLAIFKQLVGSKNGTGGGNKNFAMGTVSKITIPFQES